MKKILILVALLLSPILASAQTSTPATMYAEDTLSVDGERLMMMGYRRCNTTPTSSSATNGERVTACADANGRIFFNGAIYTPLGDSAMNDTADSVRTTAYDSTGVAVPLATGNLGAADANTTRTATASDSPDVTLLTTLTTGATPHSVISAASNNFTTVKASTGRLLSANIVNTTATLYYIKFYNDAAMITGDCASATNFLFNLPIPASTTGAGWGLPFPEGGIAFSTGIGYCIVAGATSTDNTSAATGLIGVLTYK